MQHYELPVHDLRWTTGPGQPAGVYWWNGGSLIAGHGSPAEAWLVANGAILVATLRFDRDPLEARHDERTVERLTAEAASATFPAATVN